jgi:integrase
MSSGHGATSRRAVYSGTRRVPGLYERDLADGRTVFEARLRLDGNVRRHRLEATTKTDAVRELEALRVDYRRGEEYRSPAAALTVADVAVDYVASLQARVDDRDPKRRRSQRTVDDARYKLDRYVLPVLGTIPVADLSAGDVVRLLDRLAARQLSANTRTGVLSVLSGLMRFATKRGLVERNVVRDIDRDDRPGTARATEPRYLTAGELGRLLEHLSDTFRPIAAACTYAALRHAEALGLRWSDVDFATKTITVTGQLAPGGRRIPYVKTSASGSSIELLPALERELRALRSRHASRDLRLVAADALVFVTATGRPQSQRNVLRAVHAAGDAAGLNAAGRERVGLHDLRHSFVALALDAGASMAETAALARHANARVTAQVYAGLSDDGRKKAAAKLVEAGFGR